MSNPISDPGLTAAKERVTLTLSRMSAIRLEQHLTNQFGEGPLVNQIRESLAENNSGVEKAVEARRHVQNVARYVEQAREALDPELGTVRTDTARERLDAADDASTAAIAVIASLTQQPVLLSDEDRQRLANLASWLHHNGRVRVSNEDLNLLRKLAQQHYGVEGAG